MNTLTANKNLGRNGADLDALRAKMSAVDADARENWWDDAWRREKATEITEEIFLGFMHENLLPLMATVETVGEADRITLEEVRGLDVFWVSMGGQIDETSITEQVWELPRDYLGFHVTELEEKMRSGFSRSSANLVQMAIDQMDAGINRRLLGLFQAGIPSNSPYYISGAGISLAALNTAITEVEDESKSDIISIIGRGTMVNQIMDELGDLNGFTPTTNEEILRLGKLGTYRGANIIKLKNYRDNQNVPFVPGNEMYVVGADAAKVGFWGGLTAQEWSEQGGWHWHYMGRRTIGMALRRPDYVRRIVDTSRSA